MDIYDLKEKITCIFADFLVHTQNGVSCLYRLTFPAMFADCIAVCTVETTEHALGPCMPLSMSLCQLGIPKKYDIAKRFCFDGHRARIR